MRSDMVGTLTGSSRLGAVLAALPWILAGGCTPTQKAAEGPEAGADAAAPAASASAEAEGAEPKGGDEIRPVYPVDGGPADPLAARFCDAVVVLPERRKAECCGASVLASVAATVGDQCAKTLSFALGQKAVTLSPADVDGCVAAATRATSGCDWVTPASAELPPECDAVIKGALKEKARCRSSLECPDGMRCIGLSTVDLGTCGPPRPTRAQCNVAVDMLATFTRQERFERAHPECTGYCRRGHCADAVAEGAACTSDVVCGRGRCAFGKCTSAPLPVAGEACSGACAAGLRCASGKCAAPKAEGEGCSADGECRGACVRADGGTAGTCAKSCMAWNVAAPAAGSAAAGRATPKKR
jgi:hypothetical protein